MDSETEKRDQYSSNRGKFTFTKLQDDNYENWAWYCEQVLEEEGLWDLVDPDGTEKEPAGVGSSKHEAWLQRDKVACRIIGRTVTDRFMGYVRRCTSARDLWTRLRNVLAASTKQQQMKWLSKFTNIQWTPDKSFHEYNEEFDLLLERLEACGVPLANNVVKIIYMNGLPTETFGLWIQANQVRYCDTTMEVLRSDIRDMWDESQQKTLASSKPAAGGALIAHKTQNANGISNGENKAKNSKKKGACHHCGKQGHFKRDCRERIAEEKTKEENNQNAAYGGIARTIGSAYRSTAHHDAAHAACLDSWVTGSGASHHMIGNKEAFTRYLPFKSPMIIRGISDKNCQAVGAGDVKLIDQNGHERIISNVLYVPGMAQGLISISKLTKDGWQVHFGKEGGDIRSQEFNMTMTVREGLYVLDNAAAHLARVRPHGQSTDAADINTWHRRLGHVNIEIIQRLGKAVTGLDIKDGDAEIVCEGCQLSKHTRNPFIL